MMRIQMERCSRRPGDRRRYVPNLVMRSVGAFSASGSVNSVFSVVKTTIQCMLAARCTGVPGRYCARAGHAVGPDWLRWLSPCFLCELRVLCGQKTATESCSAPDAFVPSFLEHNAAFRVGIVWLASLLQRHKGLDRNVVAFIVTCSPRPRAAHRTFSVDTSSMFAQSYDDRLAGVPVLIASPP